MYLTNVKRKILIASFLKPVNDIRAFEKMAVSIAKNNRYEVYITGYPSSVNTSTKNITLLPLHSFKRRGVSRIVGRVSVFNLYIKLKPEVVIVNSPDLLLVTMLYKILFGSKIIYDIRENYALNLRFQSNYPMVIKHVLASTVRMKETICSLFFNHFLLAEKVYKDQLKVIGKRYTIIENKSLDTTKHAGSIHTKKRMQFLISGAIAKEYGVFEGIDFFKLIHKEYPESSLIIVGHCANSKTFDLLKNIASKNSSVQLNITKEPVPHVTIEKAVLQSNFGLLPYLPNKSTDGKWPTKLFEYMAFHLPIILQTNSTWNYFIEEHQAGFVLDFTNLMHYSNQSFKAQLHSNYYEKELPRSIFWTEEEPKLFNIIDNLVN